MSPLKGLLNHTTHTLQRLTKNPNTNSQNASNSPQVNNAFTKMLAATSFLPAKAQSAILTKAFGKLVPYVGTSGVVYETVTPNKVVVSLDNKKQVRNHIGTVHAVAITLLAETATGFIVALNLPTDRVLLVKSYQINFYRPVKKGQVAAVATLTNEQRQQILDMPSGDMVIPCIIEDRNSQSERKPIVVEMTWAWFPKKELHERREGKAKTV